MERRSWEQLSRCYAENPMVLAAVGAYNEIAQKRFIEVRLSRSQVFLGSSRVQDEAHSVLTTHCGDRHLRSAAWLQVRLSRSQLSPAVSQAVPLFVLAAGLQ